MAARTKNSAVNLEITNTNDGFDIVGGNNNTGSIGVYSGSVDIIADSSATNLTYTFPPVSDVLVGATASQTLTNKTLTDPSVDGIGEEPTFARVLLYDLSSKKLGYTASAAFGGGGGGSGTPGGSDKQIQYNESGLFGGEANLTWDYDTNTFSVTGSVILNGAITASSTLYAPNIGTGVDNSVVILDSDGFLKTDEIDSRVWGNTLIDSTQTSSFVTNDQTSSFVTNDQTGSFLISASATLNTLHFTASDASTFDVTIDTGSGISIDNNTNNNVLTATGGSNINGEPNLTFDGSLLTITGRANVTTSITSSTAQLTGLTSQTYNRVVVSDSNGNLAYTASSAFGGGGGGGTPGGSDKQIQYNDGGNFGGEANLTWDYNDKILGITGSIFVSQSTSTEQFVINDLPDGGGLEIVSGWSIVGHDNNTKRLFRTGSDILNGGGSSGPTTGVSRSFYMPSFGGEYTESTEVTASFNNFNTRYVLVSDLLEAVPAVDYTLSMPNEWLTTSNVNVRLHLIVSGSTTGGPVFGVGITSIDDNESFNSFPTPTYVSASANYSGYTALDKYDLLINDIPVAGSPTTASILLMKIRREGTDTFTHDIPFIGFEIQYTENTTLPSSF